MSGERIKGETDLSYQYFAIFRDMPRDTRNIRALCGHEVDGKKREKSIIGRWHKNHDWAERVNKWDIDRAHDAMASIITRRNADIERLLDGTMTIINAAQTIVTKKMVKMSKEADPSAIEFRTVMMGYIPVREWLKELTGFMNKETEDAIKVGD